MEYLRRFRCGCAFRPPATRGTASSIARDRGVREPQRGHEIARGQARFGGCWFQPFSLLERSARCGRCVASSAPHPTPHPTFLASCANSSPFCSHIACRTGSNPTLLLILYYIQRPLCLPSLVLPGPPTAPFLAPSSRMGCFGMAPLG